MLIRLLIPLLLLSPALPLLAAEEPATPAAPPAITITDDGLGWWEHDPGKKRQGGHTFRFTGLTRNYAIKLVILQSKQEDGTWKTDTADIGMPQPIQGNWYHSGFFRINLNGKLMHVSDPLVEIVETGARGLLDFTWDHALAKVRVRLVLQPGSDHLLMEVRWEPKPELKELTIGFSCYPEGFKVSEPDRLAGKQLERHMITADRDVAQVQKVDLNLATEWWQYYQDNTLEKSPTYGPGGVALLFLPEEIEKAWADIGSYNVGAAVTPKLASGRARFALWDFNGTPNVTAVKTLQEVAPTVRAAMAADPWLPTAITGFSPAEENARLDTLAKALGSGQAAKIPALRRQVAALNAQRGAFLDNRSFEAESALRQAVSAYRLAYWQAERPTVQKVRTLFLAGPWAYGWRLDEAARAQWGSDAIKQGGYIWKYWAGHFVSYFPATLDEMLGYDVVVLADIPQNPLTEDKRQMLADYVRNGGGLLVLGGTYTGGAGKWEGSPLEPLLPVQMGDVADLKSSGQAISLTSAGGKRLGKLPGPLGVVLWRNNLKPRPGAEVWMTAGSDPFAVYAPAGAGRVVYVLGTCYGEAPAGKTAFWDAPAWPEAVVRMLGWLARGK